MKATKGAQSRNVVLALLASTLAGCAAMQARQLEATDKAIESGDHQAFAIALEKVMKLANGDSADQLLPVEYRPKFVLEHLHAAESWRLAGNLDRAVAHFDAAENALGDIEGSVAGRVGANVVGAVATDVAATYLPTPVEAILINYYKALIFLEQGKMDLARVELNRSDDRTRRAVERYTKEIEKAQKEANQELTTNQVPEMGLLDQAVSEQMAAVSQWKVYQDFIVPPAVFLQGLFLGNSTVPSDREKAIELYERLLAITEGHPVVARDLDELRKGPLCPSKGCNWIIVERGLGPTLDERRITIPLSINNRKLFIPIALPVLASRFQPAMWNCRLEDQNGAPFTECMPFADSERIVQTELAKRYPAILTRAVVGAIIKGFLQYQAAEQGGAVHLATIALTHFITAADRRIWRQLPGDFVVHRLDPGQGPAKINVSGQQIEIPAEPGENLLVHVKLSYPTHKPRPVVVALRNI